MLDPSIIMGGQPVQPQNPLQTVGALAALKNQQIEQQAGQQALQQKQYAFQGMQALNQAIAKNTQPTPDGGVTVNHEGVMKDLTAGGRADVANSYLTNYTDQREKIAKADDQELKNQIERHGQFASIINGVQSAPPERRQAAYDSAIQQAKKNKLLSPEELAKVPPQVPDDATLNSLKIGSLDVKSAAQAQKDAAEAKRAAQQTQQEAELQPGKVAEQSGKVADALTKRVGQQLSTPRSVDAYQKLWNGLSDDEKTAAEKQGFTPGDQIKNAKDVMNATAAAGKLATTVKERADIAHQGVEEQQGKQRLGIEAGRLRLEADRNRISTVAADPFGSLGLNKNPANPVAPGAAAQGEDVLKGVPPSIANRVKAIAEGREAPINGRAGASGMGGQIMALVNQYDPQFSDQKAQIRKAFTTGKDGTNIGNLNTATVHLDQYVDALGALKHGSFTPGNSAYDKLATIFGGAPPTTAKGIANAAAGEMAAALKGNATDQEIAAVHSAMPEGGSPDQIAAYLKSQLHVIGAKLNTYQERYNQQIPNDKVYSPVLPSARAVFDKNGINPTAGPNANSSGQAAPPAFKVGDSVMYGGAAHKIKEIKPNGKLVLEQ